VIGRIASALGLDTGSAQKGLGAVVPALLAGLVSLVSKPDGANRLGSALQRQDATALDRATSAIGGSNQEALIDQGTSTLSSLFGGSSLDALAGAIGRYAGVGEGQARSLLGMAAPLVLGALGNQQRSQGLDASGLARMLTGQKDSIAAALPAGLTSLLGGTGLLDGISDRLRDTTAAATRAAQTGAARVQSATRTTTTAARPVATAGTSRSWWWIIPLLAILAALAYYWYSNRGAERVAQPPPPPPAPTTTQPAKPPAPAPTPPTTTAAPSAQNLVVGGVDLRQRITDVFNQAKDTLGSVTDAASAQAALPKLKQVDTDLGGVSDLAKQLPADGKTALAALVKGAKPALDQLMDKVLALSGDVSNVLKPAIDAIKAKLDALASG
jgi:hypothetical protein